MGLDFLQLLGYKTFISSAHFKSYCVGDQVLKKGGDGGPTAKISPQCVQPLIFSLSLLKW